MDLAQRTPTQFSEQHNTLFCNFYTKFWKTFEGHLENM